jgi:hypothetical protein
MADISRLQNQLIKSARSWAFKQKFDSFPARKLRRQAILLNHAHYLQNIPLYRKLAEDEGIDETANLEIIEKKLMFSDDIFKSYSQQWLDDKDFIRMNKWLSSLFHRQIDIDMQKANSIDAWLSKLNENGIRISFSSGTSGRFSFIPREESDWVAAKTANICYLAPLLASYSLRKLPLKQSVNLIPPQAFVKVISQKGLPDFDAFFLGFKEGRMGNQMLMQELAPIFHRHYFLYDMSLSTDTLRSARRGIRTHEQENLIELYHRHVVLNKAQNYHRLLEQIGISTNEGRKVFIFGSPYQFKELCETAEHKIALNNGSLALFGGGWKSFSGEMIERDRLVQFISDSFTLPPENILEGYSMTETSVLMLRCRHGRFHIPPLIEPVIFDDELNPLKGNDLKGIFGFMDPLARSYPGFVITGDYVHMVDGECPCGLTGPAVTEIKRAKNREVKGCGGIMSSLEIPV